MEARYLVNGDVILRKNKRFKVLATKIQGNRIIVKTDGGRLTFRLNQLVTVD